MAKPHEKPNIRAMVIEKVKKISKMCIEFFSTI